MNPARTIPLFVAALALSSPASAQSTASAPTSVAPSLGASVGFVDRVITPTDLGAVRVGVEAMLHYRFVQAGVALDAGGTLFRGGFTSMVGMLGVGIHVGQVRFDLLAVGGMHNYSGARQSGGLLSNDDPGVGRALPFLGARLGIAREWGTGTRFGLGGLISVEADLEHPEVTYSYTEVHCSWFCTSEPEHTVTQTRTVTLGETFIGFQLRTYVRFQ